MFATFQSYPQRQFPWLARGLSVTPTRLPPPEVDLGVRHYLRSGELIGDMHNWPISPDVALYSSPERVVESPFRTTPTLRATPPSPRRGISRNYMGLNLIQVNTHQPVALIVVDRGSTDGTAERVVGFTRQYPGVIQWVNRRMHHSFSSSCS